MAGVLPRGPAHVAADIGDRWGSVLPPPRWVLLEHPGPWGPEPAAVSPLVPAPLREAARSRGLRLGLIHQHSNATAGSGRAFLVSAGPDPFVEQLRVTEQANPVPEAALNALATGRPSGAGQPVAEPLYLVCTQGARTPRCGQLGPAVARQLAALVGARAFETTHVGGCRFAPNLVLLPYGGYFSLLRPSEVTRVVTLAEAGRIALRRYRGRVGVPEFAQVAEVHVRRRTGLDRFGGVRLVALAAEPRGRAVAEYQTPAGRYRVVLRTARPAAGCRLARAGYRVMEMRQVR